MAIVSLEEGDRLFVFRLRVGRDRNNRNVTPCGAITPKDPVSLGCFILDVGFKDRTFRIKRISAAAVEMGI